MNREIEISQSDKVDLPRQLPFKVSPIETHFDTGDIHPQEIEQIGQEIFQAWYQHQELSRSEALEILRSSETQTGRDNVRNLLIDSYLFAQRAMVHANPNTSRELRLQSAVQDVQFQQAAVNFLLSVTDPELWQAFWQDFSANQESVNRPLREQQGAAKGIRATEAVIRQLLSDKWTVYFPEPVVDAVDKIDLVASRDGEIVFVQVKSSPDNPSAPSGKSAQNHRQDKLVQFHQAVQRYSDLTGTPIEGRIMVADS
jgi:hypothetical protein